MCNPSIGSKNVQTDPPSCNTLKRNGNTVSGVYPIHDGNSAKLSYCDMEVDGYDADMEQPLGFWQLTPEPNGVYFSAYLDEGSNIGSDTEELPITFNHILLNHGKGFDAESGTFTVPLSGYYSFHFDGRQSDYGTSGNANRVRVYKNSQLMLEMRDSGPVYSDFQHLHFSFEEKLNKGETIYLELYKSDWLFADTSHRISFTGELLYIEE